ncbi:hypothetical protein [Phytohabitans rumicis]|uniref:Uncharacterized protein n=1 Tax=Phytohabitans rumicis TaxID=1076125 RepID=A0A6V8LSP8_9ACTN|nr:hypothetical protein [Phytohabitans rumicis]GFJ95765.1 hypothetical protein Prum_094070 [Phytohabitans rumicis]
MTDHEWDEWPEDADLEPDGFDAEAETADLGGFDEPLDVPDLPDLPNVPDVPDLPDRPDLADDLEEPDEPDLSDVDEPTLGEPDLDEQEAALEDTPVGADPDLDAHADTYTEQVFPPTLDLDAPEPVDGFPWTDPATLGQAPLPDPDAAYQDGPPATDLAAYAGEEPPPGADPWTALAASEDPATSSLARWWAPEA